MKLVTKSLKEIKEPPYCEFTGIIFGELNFCITQVSLFYKSNLD